MLAERLQEAGGVSQAQVTMAIPRLAVPFVADLLLAAHDYQCSSRRFLKSLTEKAKGRS